MSQARFSPDDNVPAVPSFEKLSDSFSLSVKKTFLGGSAKRYAGPVIASEDAIFLVPLKDVAAQVAAHQFGLLGMLVSWWLSRNKKAGVEHELALDMDRLPDEIALDPEWPVKKHRGRVYVIPRPLVKDIKVSFWTGIKFETDEHKFTVSLSMFGRKKRLRRLKEYGWPVP